MFSSLASYQNTPLSVQRNGVFEMYIGKAKDVEANLAQHKQSTDAYGQLNLTANVVESSNNLTYIVPESDVGKTIYKYVDTRKATRNGVFGQDASFIYPLKAPNQVVANAQSPNADVRLGIYADGEDLKDFLNYVGVDDWTKTVKDSPDKITQYAIEFAEDVEMDAQGNPIVAKEVSSFPGSLPTQANTLNFLA
jgi:hypothetical protein